MLCSLGRPSAGTLEGEARFSNIGTVANDCADNNNKYRPKCQCFTDFMQRSRPSWEILWRIQHLAPDVMVLGQNGSGQNGTDKMVWPKWYMDKMALDKMAWTKWHGQNGTDKLVRIKSLINPALI